VSEPSVYEQIIQHLDEARRLIALAVAEDDATVADELSKQATKAFDEAWRLADVHRPRIVHNTIWTAELRELVGMDWVRLYDPVRGRFASVRWSDIEGEVAA
jgi:hypothetical protein